jgi:hypothetical protein
MALKQVKVIQVSDSILITKKALFTFDAEYRPQLSIYHVAKFILAHRPKFLF